MFSQIILFILIIPSLCWASPEVEAPKDLPYYEEIMTLIKPLEYSGFQVIVKPEISLSIDFEKQSWKLQNIHQYDSQGQIILEQGRYGLCAELATYLYGRLKSMLSNQYELKFARTTEEGFFPTYQSSHIVLLMHDRATQISYLIDPSFRKYGRASDFHEYKVQTIQNTLAFIQDKSPDVSFLMNQAMPLFIKEDLLISFSVVSVDGRFDKNNFLLVVAANQRNKISGLNIVVIGKYNSHVESFEDRAFLERFLNPQEIDNLHNKLDVWLKQNGM